MPPPGLRPLRNLLPKLALRFPLYCGVPESLPQDLENGSLPGDTEGEGGLQKSSNSELGSQTLPSQLSGVAEALSLASVS